MRVNKVGRICFRQGVSCVSEDECDILYILVVASTAIQLSLMDSYLSGGCKSTAVTAAAQILDVNSVGAIAFVTPELGKWSTVGGLGVMVDELSCTLSELGQVTWVISPYYDKNRHGESGYLAKDGIEWKFNVHVSVGWDT